MPIDPRIALGVQPPQIQTPLELQTQAAQVANLRDQVGLNRQRSLLNDQALQAGQQELQVGQQKIDAAKRREAGLGLLSKLWEQNNGQAEPIVAGLAQGGFADLAQDFQENQAKIQKEVIESELKKLDGVKKQNEILANIAGTIKDQDSLIRGVGMALSQGAIDQKRALEWLQKPWNEQTAAEIKQIAGVATSEKDRIELLLKQAEEKRKEEEHQATIAGKRTNERGLNPYQQATISQQEAEAKGLEEYRKTQAQHQRNMEAITMRGQNMTDARARDLNAINAAKPKAPTAAESTALGFYQRARQATDETEGMELQIQQMGLGGQLRMKLAPNIAQSPIGQSYIAAQRQFTEARLRKDSGAAIPSHEYENDARMYFVQPGDSPALIEQKRRARKQILESLRAASGNAYVQYYGEDRPSVQNAPAATGAAQKGVPAVGGTFNGQKVLKVERVE